MIKKRNKEIDKKNNDKRYVLLTKICPVCNNIFYTKRSIKKYCSKICAKKVIQKTGSLWFQENNAKANKSQRDKYNNNPQCKIRRLYSTRIKAAIKIQSGPKAFKTIELLGCSVQECRQYLESKFQDGMTWENHGMYGWHIDHIIPCASFDLTDPEEQKKCFHYTNLQPLWAKDNLSKGCKK